MTTTTEPDVTIDEQRIEALAGRLLDAGVAAFELTTIGLGRDLGLYDAMADGQALTADGLAAAAGIHPRYAREWLEQQAVAGLVDVAEPSPDAERRRYLLPAEHVAVLVDRDSLAYLGPIADVVSAVGNVIGALQEAFRSGGGVPFSAYGVHDMQGALNRPGFLHQLAGEWIAAIPGLAEELRTPGASVLEVGCGEGFAALALADAFPSLRVFAVDTDEASIAVARRAAADDGVSDRIRFEVASASAELDREHEGAYDLVLAFEMLHDVADPVGVLRNAKRAVKPDGVILVADERVPDEFTAPGELTDRFFYGASVVHCLPAGMSEQPSAGTGTVMRRSTLERYATEAGCTRVDVLPIDHDFFRFYRITS